jgi:ectoine hydroxylase-related dioxygenase (phytanoyl-CoA dioxygenase family)
MLTALTQQQHDRFWAEGCLVLAEAVTPAQLAALRGDLARWVEESRAQHGPWGELSDGRPRFDVAGDHSAERPLLRRVNNPCQVSEAYRQAMAESRMTDAVADLIGPNVAYHHSKINLKLPGADTEVGWHQDFQFTPHSNDDLVTALLFLDDVTEENGALMVVPGSHREGLKTLWRDGRFTGQVGAAEAVEAERRAVSAIGPAGSVCLMHTALLHGSKANGSDRSRNLSITVYRAADAAALSPSPVPSDMEGLIVRGERTNRIRLTLGEVELPDNIKTSSFFNIQAAARSAA